MNRIYSIVWSRAQRAWVVASEVVNRHGKGSGAVDRRASLRQPVPRNQTSTDAVPVRPLRLGVLLTLLALSPTALAADYYWDVDGATAGAGGASPSGTWSSIDTTLSTDAAGSSAVVPHTTTTADRLFFSAGADATGSYTVTVDGTQNIGRLTFQEGAVNLTGGTIDFGTGVHLIDGDATPDSIASTIAGSGTIRFSGGTITLNGSAPNTFTGVMQVGGNGTGAAATLILAAPGGNAVSGSALLIGSGSQTTPNGTVILGAADQINDTATVSVAAGHYTGTSFFRMNGFDETIGGINLSKSGAGSNAVFENGAATDATVTLAGSGTYSTAGGDRVNGRLLRDGGTGKLNIVVALTGTGMQTFSGITPTYTGTTTINSGTLRLWNTSLWASDITLNGGTLQLHQTLSAPANAGAAAPNPRTHAHTISGTGGTLQKTGDGIVILSGNNTYQGATQIDEGTLRAGSTTAFGNNSAVTLADTAGATMDLNNFNISIGSLAGGGVNGGNVTLGSGTLTTGGDDSDTTYGGVISGSGDLIKTGTGTFALSGTNVYSGGTTIAAGTLQLGAGGNSGSITGDVLNNGTLAFNRADIYTYGGQITGAGAVVQQGSGETVLTGTNTYGGGTTISAGTLSVSSNSNLGDLAGGVTLDGGTLRTTSDFSSARNITLNASGGTIRTDADLTLTSVIGGIGALTKTGSGALILNTDNTYTGSTNVMAGTFAVGDAAHAATVLSSNVNVASGGTLGGYGSVTGNVVNAGTLAVANAIPTFAGSGSGTFTVNGDLNNAGIIQVAGSGVANRLVVNGNYAGQNGLIRLNAFLGPDGSPSDRLILDGGTASGISLLEINNVGGAGNAIKKNGILVIQAVNGANTGASTFSLANPVKAGAYEYYLAKSGFTAGTGQNWYLRNFLTTPIGTPTTPLYRRETPIYTSTPMVSRELSLQQLGSYRDRYGDRSLIDETQPMPAFWMRTWASDARLSQQGTVSPEFDGSLFGMQIGHDLYRTESADGSRNHFGVMGGYSRAVGDVQGFAAATPDLHVGNLAINEYSAGGYWTHFGSTGWYTDTVLMGSKLSIDAKSNDGGGDDFHGKGVAGSIEAGFPILLSDRVVLEPQAQLIWQRLWLDDFHDGVSSVDFDQHDNYRARIGARLRSSIKVNGNLWQPYINANILRDMGQGNETTFSGATTLNTNASRTSGQIAAGVVGKLSQLSTVYAGVSYQTNLDSHDQRILMGNIGVQLNW